MKDKEWAIPGLSLWLSPLSKPRYSEISLKEDPKTYSASEKAETWLKAERDVRLKSRDIKLKAIAHGHSYLN